MLKMSVDLFVDTPLVNNQGLIALLLPAGALVSLVTTTVLSVPFFQSKPIVPEFALLCLISSGIHVYSCFSMFVC